MLLGKLYLIFILFYRYFSYNYPHFHIKLLCNLILFHKCLCYMNICYAIFLYVFLKARNFL